MIRKQLAHVISESLNYFFNWDQFMINQILLSGMLVFLFCKSFLQSIINYAIDVVYALKDSLQRYKEQHDENGVMLFGIPLRHRHHG